jgi:hypothetical protein
MSTLRWTLIGIVLSATWMWVSSTNWFGEFGQRQRYEYRLNGCRKLATKDEKMAVQPECRLIRPRGDTTLSGSTTSTG